MEDFGNALSLSASGMKAQAQRLRYVSENISNADTPGYRRKLTSFEEVSTDPLTGDAVSGGVQVGDVTLDQGELPRVYAPGHPMADGSGYYDGSNVDLVVEIADAREAQRSYEANLRLFDQSRQMSSAVLDLLKR
ncbi:flagellar basal body rod protein FlgC [Paenirhodobacter sp.]|jgi:flagellar basal-body rod protein FlgC|uniref:flagellar basal body rod protein FlgC n=1 Tax=Paenirhodobacter sp. TaxID=1965326 RepID=UPI003B512D96